MPYDDKSFLLLDDLVNTELGSPEQDAQRRDFTLNALFLNVNSLAIEDLCGTGVEDLRAGLLRTPLAAVEVCACKYFSSSIVRL